MKIKKKRMVQTPNTRWHVTQMVIGIHESRLCCLYIEYIWWFMYAHYMYMVLRVRVATVE